ncbi:CHAD domain-containing protein [Desulfobulbus rhabdoformis]|uniref:CHAD domain-containing protein n=1 Tax=Desulfobulbus rhabdoformis TaxID=34032 RepID=UPI001962C165|nr:CHAD domain-containing protein [Desulfobulbus rhabdoformis]MBM9613516.1 CHAD domain-containing protein [Desulfobulbus rhabdoformis]
MNPNSPETWLIPEDLHIDDLFASLKEKFALDVLPEYSAKIEYVDTFDWELYREKYLLHNNAGSWSLYHENTCSLTLEKGGPKLDSPCFSSDFPPGPLRDVLTPILGIRCLLPVATVLLAGQEIRLLNRDEKTVVRLIIERQQPEGQAYSYRLVRLVAVRGYDKELSAAQEILEENGIVEVVSALIGFEEACRCGGRYPLDYSSKFQIQLSPRSTAREAIGSIYLELLDNMRINIPGVMADWDIEFLHDLRVAIRRTRSGLSLVKQVLPDALVSRFKKEFAALGSVTGPTRDLDVYLKDRQKYLDRLPPALQPGLELFFDQLAKKRQAEQKKLVRHLRTKKISILFDDWQRSIEQEELHPAPKAQMPVLSVANPIIFKHYKRVLKTGLSVDRTSPDDDVHALRIQCKKLRYSMEFFASLYPKKELQVVIKHLKKLQDILGIFNDLYVQQTMVLETLGALNQERPTKTNLSISASLGGLLQSLYQEQEEVRYHFKEAFIQFTDEETTTLCHQLFKKKQVSK